MRNMNIISSIVLAIGGMALFANFGYFYTDLGIIGFICFIIGIFGFFFPKITGNFLNFKSKNNSSAIILLLIILIPSLIYIWYKLYN